MVSALMRGLLRSLAHGLPSRIFCHSSDKGGVASAEQRKSPRWGLFRGFKLYYRSAYLALVVAGSPEHQ